MMSDGLVTYKGHLVIQHSSKHVTSWALGGVIFLNREYKTETSLQHEYGHILQEQYLGAANYINYVFVPSALYNLFSRFNDNLHNNYYNMPWEYDADIRGQAERNHDDWAEVLSELYFIVVR